MKLVTSKTGTDNRQEQLHYAKDGDCFLIQDYDGEQWVVMRIDNGGFVILADDRDSWPPGTYWLNATEFIDDIGEDSTVTYLNEVELHTNV